MFKGARAVGARGQYESQRQEFFVQEEALVKCEFFDFKRVGEEKAKKVFVKQEQGVEQVFKGCKGQPNFNCFDRCARAGS
jgi:hypothetical protein